jgi:hypothetical protein
MIQKKYISFEIARLLNLCNIDWFEFFDVNTLYTADYYFNKNTKEFREYDFIIDDNPDDWYYAIEVWQILDWLENNIQFFDLWIEPVLSENPKQYRWKIWHRGQFIESAPFSTKDEATYKGIEWALTEWGIEEYIGNEEQSH